MSDGWVVVVGSADIDLSVRVDHLSWAVAPARA